MVGVSTRNIRWLTAVVCGLAASLADAAEIPAFPGAEGFGANTPGGRGGRVIYVTTLADYGRGEAPIEGSLRAACTARGPRTILFAVSGTIELRNTLKISEPFVTVAGQTAPGDGVCLKNHTLAIATHDVVVRYLRVRPGDELAESFAARGQSFEPDAISIAAPSRNVVVDHCSASWSIDECVSVSGAGITDVTVQWCLISESLTNSAHQKGAHGYGSLVRTNGNVTYHHNLYAHHASRCPRPGTYGEGSILFDFRNNVIYDGRGYSAADPVRMNYVGNYIKRPRSHVFQIGGPATRMFVADNFLEGGGPRNDEPWAVISNAGAVNQVAQPFATFAVTTDTPHEAFRRVLDDVGASRPRRDPVDARVIEQVRSGTGKLIDSQTEVGGWPPLRGEPLLPDADGDGMPDAWELRHGLNPHDPADGPQDANGDGYTNLEAYLNGLDPHAAG